MKWRKSPSIALLVALLLLAGGVAARSRGAQQTGDQPKADPSTAKKDKKPPKADGTAHTPPVAPSAPTAPAAGTPASTPNGSTPASPSTAPQQSKPAVSGGIVWVNTATGVYHKPGSRYYGKTK
jgi:hypothetical protein